MARSKRTRASKRDTEKLKRLERNVKAKQRRIKKHHNINVDFRFKEIEDITPKQAKLYEQKLEKFTSRKTHQYKRINDEFSIPLEEYKRFKKNVEDANKNRKRVRDKVDKMLSKPQLAQSSNYSGSFLDYYSGLLGNPKMHFLDPLSVNLRGTHSYKEFKEKDKVYRRYANPNYIEKSVRDMKRNYIKGILNPDRGIVSGSNPDVARRLANRIKRMPLEDFYAMYLSEENLDWTYIYNEEDKEMMASLIDSSIDRAYAGEYVNGEKEGALL